MGLFSREKPVAPAIKFKYFDAPKDLVDAKPTKPATKKASKKPATKKPVAKKKNK